MVKVTESFSKKKSTSPKSESSDDPDTPPKKGIYYEKEIKNIKNETIATVLYKRKDKVDFSLRLHFLSNYLNLPSGNQRAGFIDALGLRAGMDGYSLKAHMESLYASSQLKDTKFRMQWLKRDVNDFKESNDGFIKAAVALYDESEKFEKQKKIIDKKIKQKYASYLNVLFAFNKSRKNTIYPDADSTLRFTYGQVKGGSAVGGDGITWTPFTTLRGIENKHTGEGEFSAPKVQIEDIRSKSYGEYYDASLDSVPVNFLATFDGAPGSSGSPILNEYGELVGLFFDGTVDSMIGDSDMKSDPSRVISVDLRYILWYIKYVDKAHNLLKELGQVTVL